LGAQQLSVFFLTRYDGHLKTTDLIAQPKHGSPDDAHQYPSDLGPEGRWLWRHSSNQRRAIQHTCNQGVGRRQTLIHVRRAQSGCSARRCPQNSVEIHFSGDLFEKL
jgi:hypothetical protein